VGTEAMSVEAKSNPGLLLADTTTEERPSPVAGNRPVQLGMRQGAGSKQFRVFSKRFALSALPLLLTPRVAPRCIVCGAFPSHDPC